MRRGDIWTAAARGACTGKPRPVVVVQDERFDGMSSVTVCPLTTSSAQAPLLRITVEATAGSGIDEASTIMVDKIVTIPRSGLRDHIGSLDESDLVRLNRSLLVFLGLIG